VVERKLRLPRERGRHMRQYTVFQTMAAITASQGACERTLLEFVELKAATREALTKSYADRKTMPNFACIRFLPMKKLPSSSA
jgi:hypothetical protein